jgi:hypothetical protein
MWLSQARMSGITFAAEAATHATALQHNDMHRTMLSMCQADECMRCSSGCSTIFCTGCSAAQLLGNEEMQTSVSVMILESSPVATTMLRGVWARLELGLALCPVQGREGDPLDSAAGVGALRHPCLEGSSDAWPTSRGASPCAAVGAANATLRPPVSRSGADAAAVGALRAVSLHP